MLNTRALPDEYYLGHLVRLLRLNQCNTRHWFAAQRATPKLSRQDNLTRFTALAHSAGLSHDVYAKLHTLLPLYRRVSAPNPSAESYGVFDTRHLLGVDPFNKNAVASACRSCIEEDIGWFGYAYWRRTHQVPGSAWCIKHEEPLLKTHSYKNPFTLLPSQALDRMLLKENSDLIGVSAIQTAAVSQYQEVATALLGGSTCSPPESAAAEIGNLNGLPNDISIKTRMLEVIEATFPKKWLHKRFASALARGETLADCLFRNSKIRGDHSGGGVIYALLLTITDVAKR